eukprot:5575034-Amphidinium_carterae.1
MQVLYQRPVAVLTHKELPCKSQEKLIAKLQCTHCARMQGNCPASTMASEVQHGRTSHGRHCPEPLMGAPQLPPKLHKNSPNTSEKNGSNTVLKIITTL